MNFRFIPKSRLNLWHKIMLYKAFRRCIHKLFVKSRHQSATCSVPWRPHAVSMATGGRGHVGTQHHVAGRAATRCLQVPSKFHEVSIASGSMWCVKMGSHQQEGTRLYAIEWRLHPSHPLLQSMHTYDSCRYSQWTHIIVLKCFEYLSVRW